MVGLGRNSAITVVLNAYRRVELLEQQIDAIEAQTIKPTSILVWHNAGCEVPQNLLTRAVFAECNSNLGVWARFAFALNAETEYICVFDDDTIPGRRWLENCIRTLSTHEGLLGTRGLKFVTKGRYYPSIGVGWDVPNSQIERVDIVGHSWFFRREWLGAFWREMPPADHSKFAGEDIHFSYTLQKYLNINTFVPPHPIDDKELWGSLPEFGKQFGASDAALSTRPGAMDRFNRALKYYCDNGFQYSTSEEEKAKVGLVVGPGIRYNEKLRRFVVRYPLLHRLGRLLIRGLEKLKIHI